MSASIQIHAYQNRTTDWDIQLLKADETTPALIAATDVVRIKIGRGRGTIPTLDLNSVAATANGSVVTFTEDTNDIVLRIAQGDTENMTPGSYSMEILVVDDSETEPADAMKHAQQGVFHLIGQMTGDVGTS